MVPNGIYTGLTAQYKVYKGIWNTYRTYTHIRHTSQHVDSPAAISCNGAQTAICATTALFAPADSLEATHTHLQISPSSQRPTLKRGKTEPANAQTAPLKIASKAALLPACGEDRQVAAPMHQRES